MSITDELREYVGNFYLFRYKDVRDKLTAIADRIDERHTGEVGAAKCNGYVEAMDKVDFEYVKLPVDADGVPIHVGDYVETLIDAFKGERGRVECLTLMEDGWCVDGDRPSTVRHVQPDSWERIIHDATGAGWMGEGVFDEKDFERIEAELVERCRRLAGE